MEGKLGNIEVSCDRCRESFDEDHHIPTILPDCAHTVCASCVQEIIEEQNDDQRCCNICETKIDENRVAEDFKVNFKLLSLISSLRDGKTNQP
jgi:hypothetical protein